MLAKLFLKDLDLKKVDAAKILGLDGTRGGGNQLDIKFKQYASIGPLLKKGKNPQKGITNGPNRKSYCQSNRDYLQERWTQMIVNLSV